MRFKNSHIFVWRRTGCSAINTQEEKGLPGAERVRLNNFGSYMIHCPVLTVVFSEGVAASSLLFGADQAVMLPYVEGLPQEVGM